MGAQEADSEMDIGGQKDYLRKLFESTLRKGRKRCRIGLKEDMDCDTVSIKASATILGSLAAPIALQTCPQRKLDKKFSLEITDLYLDFIKLNNIQSRFIHPHCSKHT